MPWHIGSSASCPKSKPYAVIKDSDGSVSGCHPTKAAAQKQLAALYANEPGAKSMADSHMKPEDLADIPPARLPFPVTRAVASKVEARETDGAAMPTMALHFSTFGDWYEVDSWIEGRFLEQIGRRAFDKTISESRDSMKVLYDHGQDPQIGNKILGPIDVLRTDKIGPYSEVPLFDTSYNRDLSPGLKAGVYGSSFRFTVEKDTWDNSPERSDYNPDAIPERTITEARVFEFGPVTFPANPNATAGVRSTTDTFYQRSRDPEAFESLLRTAQAARTPVHAGAAAQSDEPPDDTPEAPPPEPSPPDTPRIEPPPAEPAETQEDPPEGGSPDSRSKKVDLTTIDEKRARFDELNESLDKQAAAYPGVLPDDEQVRWNADVDERDKLGKDLAAWESRQAALIDRGAKDKNVERPYSPPPVNQINRKAEADLHTPESRATSYDGRVAEFRDDAKRILEKTTFTYGLSDQARSLDKVAHLIDTSNVEMAERVKYTSSPAYLRAFDKFLKSAGGPLFLTAEEQRGTALAVGVDATGGFTVPFAFDPTVIAIGSWSGAVNPYRRACRVVSISGTDTWNAITSTAVVATRTTEAAAAVEQGPTFAQPQYIVTRVQGQITASFEMFQDRTDLASEMASLIQEAKDNEEENSMAVGATAAANIGIGPVTGTSGAFTSLNTAGAALAAADAIATEAALPVRHRFYAQWFLSRSAIRRFQALETTGGQLFGGNQYPAVGNPAIDGAGNTGLRLLGYPVNESPSLPSATTTTITVGTLANVNQYVIVDRIGMSVQFIPFIFNSSALATGQQALYFLYRNTAKPINVDGGRILRYV
jgi:HK97 family phage major capsid protein/HK97 family phage prohead protease